MSESQLPNIGRRGFLRSSLGVLVAQAVSGAPMAEQQSGFFKRNHLPIGLQLYTLGKAADKDFEDALSRVARIGFQTVELAGYYGREPAALRAAADRTGLRITSIHVGGGDRMPGLNGDIAALSAAVHVLGATTVVLPFPLLRQEGDQIIHPTLDDWQRTASLLNEKGRALRQHGLHLAYHNHNIEFAPVSGTTGFDVIARETDPDGVAFEMDVGWVVAAGRDPLELLNRFPGRFQLIHVKDLLGSTQTNYDFKMDSTEVGRGIIDWRRLIPAAFAAGARQFFVEQEPPFTQDRFHSVADSFHYLASMP